MATKKREFSLILHGEEIYEEASNYEITDFVGVSVLINLEESYDHQQEEGHGVHTISYRETEITSAFVYVVNDDLDVVLVQKISDPTSLMDVIKKYI